MALADRRDGWIQRELGWSCNWGLQWHGRRNRDMFRFERHLPSAKGRRDDQLQEALHVRGQLRVVVLWRRLRWYFSLD